jgi:hypothetical protein
MWNSAAAVKPGVYKKKGGAANRLDGFFFKGLSRISAEHLFKTFFTETPLTADLNTGYLTFADQAVQGPLLDLKEFGSIANIHDIFWHYQFS